MPEFFVAGLPATAGSKKAFPIRRKDGKLGVSVVADCKRSKPWMSRIAEAAGPHFTAPVAAGRPISLSMMFILPRPKYHFGTKGNLLPSAPMYPAVRPDCSKLVRCAEDALKGVAWHDDSQVVRLQVEKITGIPGLLLRGVCLDGKNDSHISSTTRYSNIEGRYRTRPLSVSSDMESGRMPPCVALRRNKSFLVKAFIVSRSPNDRREEIACDRERYSRRCNQPLAL